MNSADRVDIQPDRLLRAARRSRVLSQRELATLAGLPPSTVARIEARATVPRVDTFARLLAAAGYLLVPATWQGRPLMLDDEQDRLRDRAERRFPAHLEAVPTPSYWSSGPAWWGWHRIAWYWLDDPAVPAYCYWRRCRQAELPAEQIWEDAT